MSDYDDTADNYHERADEGTSDGAPRLFANRVWRIYQRAGVELGFGKRARAEANTTAPKPTFGRVPTELRDS